MRRTLKTLVLSAALATLPGLTDSVGGAQNSLLIKALNPNKNVVLLVDGQETALPATGATGDLALALGGDLATALDPNKTYVLYQRHCSGYVIVVEGSNDDKRCRKETEASQPQSDQDCNRCLLLVGWIRGGAFVHGTRIAKQLGDPSLAPKPDVVGKGAPSSATKSSAKLDTFDPFALLGGGVGRYGYFPDGAELKPVEPETQKTVSVLEFLDEKTERRAIIIGKRRTREPFDLARVARELFLPRVDRGTAPRSSVLRLSSSVGGLWSSSGGPREVHGVSAAAAGLSQRPATSPAAVGSVKVFVTSLGRLGADAFRIRVVNASGKPVTLQSGIVALEPVARLTEQDFQKELATLSGFPQQTFTTRGYCLEREKNAPPAGMVFRLAPADRQREMAPVDRILSAARHLRDAKALTPDTDPEDHYHSIVQWAIWSDQEKFDERAFATAFTAYTRKNVVAGGHRWSREVEQAVRDIVPGRWRDISKVLNEARKPPPERP